MRVLCFNAKIIVHLEMASAMTPEQVAEQVVDEICMGADIPQPSWVEDYAIKDITVTFAEESAPVPDEADDKDSE